MQRSDEREVAGICREETDLFVGGYNGHQYIGHYLVHLATHSRVSQVLTPPLWNLAVRRFVATCWRCAYEVSKSQGILACRILGMRRVGVCE
jgi:hypothetical protein